MLSILNKNGIDKGLCNALMEFLEYNKDLLTSYLTPSKLSKHCKDNYSINQLLETPGFARQHLSGYVNVECIGQMESLSSALFKSLLSSSSSSSIFNTLLLHKESQKPRGSRPSLKEKNIIKKQNESQEERSESLDSSIKSWMKSLGKDPDYV